MSWSNSNVLIDVLRKGCWLRLLLLSLTAAACSSPPNVPVSSRETVSVRQQTEKIGGEHVTFVRRGDTLYSIAFGAGVSPAEVAAWNGISQDATLYEGRKLRLTKPLNFVPRRSSAPVASSSSSARSPVAGRSKNQAVVKQNADNQRRNAESSKVRRVEKQTNVKSDFKWAWPTRGKVVNRFSISRGQKGIDIRGSRGQVITSSAAGRVVYAGNGLRGYGNLLIIKHDENFLSAYAHNDKMFVAEDDWVKKGQKISVMGVAKQGIPMLHFEIRLQGKPVDPVKYLPNR